MIIKSLKINNFRRFQKVDIEFPENVIGIIGENGAGKSSLIEAIGWVLYGNRFVRTDKSDIRTQGVKENQACTVEMIFEYGGHEYCAVRKLKGKNAISEAAIYRDKLDEPEAVQDRGVNQFVEDLLQLDYRSFTTSVFAQQKELAKLSSFQPEERRQSINRLINIDQIDKARDKVRRDKNEQTAFLNGKKSNIKDIPELKAQKEKLLPRQKELQQQTEIISSEIKEKTSHNNQLNKDLQDAEKTRDLFLHWQAHLEKLESLHNETNKTIDKLNEEKSQAVKSEKDLEELEPFLKEFDNVKTEKENYDALATQKAALDGKINEKKLLDQTVAKEQHRQTEYKIRADQATDLQLRLSQFTSDEKKLSEKIQTLQQKANKYQAQLLSSEQSGKEVKEKLLNIKKLGPQGQCPECGQILGDHYNQAVDEQNLKLEKLREQYRSMKELFTDADKERKTGEKEISELRSEKEKLIKQNSLAAEAVKTYANIQSAIEEYNQNIKQLDDYISKHNHISYNESEHQKLKSRLNELYNFQQKAVQLKERACRKTQIVKEITEYNEKIQTLETDKQESIQKQKELKFDQDIYQKLKQDYEVNNKILHDLRDQHSNLREELAIVTGSINQIENDIKKQKELRKEIEGIEEKLCYLNALDEYLGKFRLELAGRIRPLIAYRASELVALTTNSRYSILELDADYNIFLYDGNESFPLARFSGGEQDLVNLCLRIAISHVVTERQGGSPINFIVLDEIFGSQDTERRSLILNALEKMSTQFRQIFLITHIEQIKDMLPVIVQVEQSDPNYSQALLV